MTNDLLQLEQHGFTVIPPGSRSATASGSSSPARALESVQVLGVVGSPLKKRKAKRAPEAQIELFEE